MTLRPLILGLAALVSACAHGDPDLPVCDGLDRRPANPHGSVLAAPPTSPVPAAADAADVDVEVDGAGSARPDTGGCA
jgi:hypothetical protein